MSGYSVFSFELLHILHHAIFTSMKERTVSYLFSDRPRNGLGQRRGQMFVKIRAPVLRG